MEEQRNTHKFYVKILGVIESIILKWALEKCDVV
jgi:hypothetical protein